MITNVDSKDVPPDAGVDGTQNLNPNINGKLAGAATISIKSSSYGDNALISKLLKRSTGEYDLVQAIGTGSKMIKDFYGTLAETTDANDAKCLVLNNQEAHVGCGVTDNARWIGWVGHGQFGLGEIFTISGATDASPIEITVDTKHFYGTGDKVIITGVITANSTPDPSTVVNGTWTIIRTGVDPTDTFTLNGSSGDGAYVSGGTVTRDVVIVNSECVNDWHVASVNTNGEFDIDSITAAGTDGPFETRWYQYAITCVYDGYQESPMANLGTVYTNNDGENGNGAETLTVVIRADGGYKDPEAFNPRISQINLYRSACPSVTDSYKSFEERSEFTLVEEIDINDAGWGNNGDDMRISIVDYGKVGVTYGQMTGLSEKIFTTGMKWTVSCEANNYHFVGNCLHSNLTSSDGSHMIFRSKAKRYDTFDWTKDYLLLPFIPTAMVAFNRRVYAFDDNQIARINPESFFIEQIYPGAGCDSQQSFVETEFGLFFANGQACFRFDGSTVSVISNPIKNIWQADGGTISVTYDGQTDQVLFFRGTSNVCYAYHIGLGRWDEYSDPLGGSDITGVFSGKDGESYISTDATSGDQELYQYFGSSSERAWVWISPEYDFNDPSQNKMFDKVDVDDSVGSTTTLYSVNGTNSPPTTAIASLDHDRGKTIQIKISGDGGATGEVTDSMSIVFRRMVGKR